MSQFYPSYQKEYFDNVEMSRNEILLLVGLLFLIVGMPITYLYVHKLTRYVSFIPEVVNSSQTPTTFGVLLHAFVLIILLYIMLEISKRYT